MKELAKLMLQCTKCKDLVGFVLAILEDDKVVEFMDDKDLMVSGRDVAIMGDKIVHRPGHCDGILTTWRAR